MEEVINKEPGIEDPSPFPDELLYAIYEESNHAFSFMKQIFTSQTRDKELEQSVCQELSSAMRLSLKCSKEYVISAQWLKPYLQILSARHLNQLIKLSLGALRRFLLSKGEFSHEVFTDRVINELILVLINCKFEEIDLHDTYNISILILKVLEAIFQHEAATKLRQDTILALLDYLEDESQLEGLRELVKVVITTIIKALFTQPSMHSAKNGTTVLVAVFKHICNTAEHLCTSREALKSSSDYKLKLQSVDALNFNLSLIYRMLKLTGPFLSEISPLVPCVSSQLCPILHQLGKWENLAIIKYGYILTFEVLHLAYQRQLPFRNQLEILLQVYLVEKIEAIRESIVTSPVILPADHHLYNFLEVVLEYIHQLITVTPEMLTYLYLNYDVQLFSLPIVQNLFKALSNLAGHISVVGLNAGQYYHLVFMTFYEICKGLMSTGIRSEDDKENKVGYMLEQKTGLSELIRTHNQSPKQFLQKCQEMFGSIDRAKLPELIGKILRYHKEANVEKVIETACGPSDLQKEILTSFCNTFNFEEENMEDAMRLFVSSARLVGESQVIERCLNAFAKKFYNDAGARNGFKSLSVAVTFAYSIMILHTDLHHKTLKSHMSLEGFLKNNTKINEGENLPEELLTTIYESIQAKEFSTPARGVYLPEFNECAILIYNFLIGVWKDINRVEYMDKKIAGEIDISLLLDMNDVNKPQIGQRTGHFISCTGLNPVLLRYVIKNAVESFLAILNKAQINLPNWQVISQPELVATILNTIELFTDISATHSLPYGVDKLIETLYELAGIQGKITEWASQKTQVQATHKLCAVVKRHHSTMKDSLEVMVKLLIFQASVHHYDKPFLVDYVGISKEVMDKGLLTNPMKEGGSSSASTGGNKSLFDTFLDYFASSPEEEGDVPHGIIAGAKAKSLSLKTKIKQCLENMPFDYSPLFESATAPNSALTGFIQSMNVYELIRGTKYFEDAELDRLLDEVYIQICQGQIYAIFILLELVVTNKDRLEISWPVLEKLFNDSILKAKTEENTDPSVVYQKSQKKHVVSPVVELFAPITIYLFLLHSPRLCHHESLARMTGILINYVEQKFVSNYSANFCLMHLKALANFYRICASKLTDCGLFEAVLNFVDSSLDCISSSVDLAEEILGLGEVVVVLLSPALDSLSDTLNHHLITKIIEIIIKTIQILETKCEPGVDAVTPILMVLYNITQKNFKQDQDEGFKYIRQMVCLKGLQSVVISMKETKPKSALEALSVLNKTVIEMLHRPTITPKEVADIFKMILFPISEHYGKNFPSFTALPLALSEVMSKGFLLVLERISKTHDMPFIWMNTLKHLLLLIDKAHQVQAVEYIETMIERIKSIVMTMISMGLLSIVDGEEMEENTTQEKQLSVSSWKAIDAFLPDLKGEVAKILDAK